ncbi:MAG: nucleotide-binding protein [Acidimicrobiaceae bacterium]|nr:nucleotide-binding protein [Acidimicrobiaceae bacterium]
MSLPTRTTVEDIDAVCGYLVTKPTGATLGEAKAVVDGKRLDGRKLSALRYWGLLDDDQNRLKITERGRAAVKDAGSGRSAVLRDVIREVRPYFAIVERMVHRHETSITATDVASHWHEHLSDVASGTDAGLNGQAVCFFHIAQGADLGVLTLGRRGQQTRFDFDADTSRSFVSGSPAPVTGEAPPEELGVEDIHAEALDASVASDDGRGADSVEPAERNNRVFITHGNNLQILEQLKELVTYGKFEPVVAVEHETAAIPVPQKVMEDMRACRAAVIHVGAERILYDEDGVAVPQINDNVLIEIGAAMALYGDNFVLLVEEGLELPSNLQGLYECRYQGDELNMPATMKLLKAFNEF